MTGSQLQIQLAADTGHYQPSERIAGRFFAETTDQEQARAVELSVLWYTAGKGAEDFAVHFFKRYSPEGQASLDLRTPRSFSVQLPRSPLSYDGQIVKVCWCVRLRVFLPRGQEVVKETPFRLGNVDKPNQN